MRGDLTAQACDGVHSETSLSAGVSTPRPSGALHEPGSDGGQDGHRCPQWLSGFGVRETGGPLAEGPAPQQGSNPSGGAHVCQTVESPQDPEFSC